MKKFSALYKQAAARKGGENALEGMIVKPRSKTALIRIPDDRWLSGMAKAVFRAGFNWSVIDRKWPDIEAAFNGFDPHRVAFLSDDDLDVLLKDARIIRHWRKLKAIRTNAQSKDVVAALSRESVFDGSPTSKSSLADIQNAFNEWVDDGGESLIRVSRVLAFTVG